MNTFQQNWRHTSDALRRLAPTMLLLFAFLYERCEIRRLDSALKESRKMLRRTNSERNEFDRLKTDFVSMVSHELRAPLTNINGAIELLLQPGADLEPEHVRGMLRIIQEQSLRLTRMVEGVLSVSRIEAGRLALYPTWVDVGPIIVQVVEALREQTAIHEFCIHVDEALPLVWADAGRLQEILFNLLDNAVKYSPEGGQVMITVEAEDDALRVSVSDSGAGIAPQDLRAIFGKFYRLDRGDDRETYGYGLGLYIARHLVEAHGGEMWAESFPGKGSTFYFRLPLHPTETRKDMMRL